VVREHGDGIPRLDDLTRPPSELGVDPLEQCRLARLRDRVSAQPREAVEKTLDLIC
jgi:hypothetical protein